MRGAISMVVAALSFAVASQAQGQQSIAVSAVVVEPVTAGEVEVEVRAEAGRLSVRRPAAARAADSRVLRRTYIGKAAGGQVRPGGQEWGELPAGAAVLVDAAAELMVTKVVAANS